MKAPNKSRRQPQTQAGGKSREKRWGSIILLASGMMIMVFGFLAFTVDVGYIALTKAQLENATDAGANAAVIELRDGLGFGATKTEDEAEAAARQAAVDVAAANRAGDQHSIYADPNRDVRFGNVTYDPQSGTWVKQWGQSPYNMVELTLHRDQLQTESQNDGDGPLPLFFAPVIGHEEALLSTKGTTALLPGNGFRVPTGSGKRADLLPFAMDDLTWDNLMDHNIGEQDKFTCHEDGSVTWGGDGIQEVNLYPHGKNSLPPGNRGTVDLGHDNNSTADLARQILYGLNDYDLSFFPNNEVKASESEPLDLKGDTGISAGFKDELEAIIGECRAIPIFTGMPQGNGNNATYTIVKFVGVKIVDVKLTGNPKYVMIQPAPYSDDAVTPDYSGDPITDETIFTSPVLIE